MDERKVHFDEDADVVSVQETVDMLQREQEMAEEMDGLQKEMTEYD